MGWTYILLIIVLFIISPIILIAQVRIWLQSIHKWIVDNWETSRAYASCLGAIVSLFAITLLPITFYNLYDDYYSYKKSLQKPEVEMVIFYNEKIGDFGLEFKNNSLMLIEGIRIHPKIKEINRDSSTFIPNLGNLTSEYLQRQEVTSGWLKKEWIGSRKNVFGLVFTSCKTCNQRVYWIYIDVNDYTKSFYAIEGGDFTKIKHNYSLFKESFDVFLDTYFPYKERIKIEKSNSI